MKPPLIQAFSAEDFRADGHTLIDLIADYLQAVQSEEDMPVCPLVPPEDSLSRWKDQSFTSPKAFYQQIIQSANHLHHPHYMGHQVSPALPSSALSGLLVSFLKNASGVFEMAPAGTAIEKIVANEFARFIGFGTQSDGIITSGGTLANLTAMLTARQVKGTGDIWNDGLENNPNLAIMVSEEAHYCIERAARIMGLGAKGLVTIPITKEFKTNPAFLESVYQKHTAEGKKVFAIVGNACSTATGAHDDLRSIGRFAQAKNIWYHVDAAHGGAALFSDKYRNLLDGIELADSVVIDAHKMMLTSGLCTALIYKDGNNSYRTFQFKAQYLFEESQDKEWFNMAKRTFECTKFMNALNTYQVLKQHGPELIGAYVDQTYDLAKAFFKSLDSDPLFETIHHPSANILCFRYFDEQKNKEELDQLNRSILEAIVRSGDFYLVSTTINNTFYLRVSIMNPLTTLTHLQALAVRIKKQALASSTKK